MASLTEWIEGARLRTLAASIAPVITGTALAWYQTRGRLAGLTDQSFPLLAPGLCLIVALGFQIGSNYANDYADGIRGTDDTRVGPQRLVGSGAASPRAVKRAAYLSFAIAGAAGLIAVITSGAWIMVLVGGACAAAAWFYTGGKRPYGYAGLGEVFVFVFFGLVATLGTTLVLLAYYFQRAQWYILAPPQSLAFRYLSWGPALLAATAMGAFATAILVANNLRDRLGDEASNKRTLAVRLGDRATRGLYVGLISLATAAICALAAWTSRGALIGLVGVALAIWPVVLVARGAQGTKLVAVLKWTGIAELVCAFGLFVGWVWLPYV
ncbi:MAG: 1,4-dihydroxy-2-naphthoate polyprenyltransferase [Propionibacteriaceae bacterium]|jgi:1,4-dihydroxy-2-naphthoate octaprenyltransferase|nr:1,4-dihydroxy-2-naphthoate polyprenyltransferase [Propionibacteriaceae bacterium]